MNWISLKEQLPAFGQDVLLAWMAREPHSKDKGENIAKYDVSRLDYITETQDAKYPKWMRDGIYATHWMPIPEFLAPQT